MRLGTFLTDPNGKPEFRTSSAFIEGVAVEAGAPAADALQNKRTSLVFTTNKQTSTCKQSPELKEVRCTQTRFGILFLDL